jgi:hypothetical protein
MFCLCSVCERFIYFQDLSVYFSAAKFSMWTDPGNINRSQTLECRNKDWGHAIPFPARHKLDFRYSMFKLCYTKLKCFFLSIHSLLKTHTGLLVNYSVDLFRRGIILYLRVPECLPFCPNWLPPPPLPQASVFPPWNQGGGGGGNTGFRVRVRGEPIEPCGLS